MYIQSHTRSDLLTGTGFSASALGVWDPREVSTRSSADISSQTLNWATETPAQSAPASPVRETTEPLDPATKVYDQLVALKVSTASLAMHLEQAWRSGLFKQLDDLLDADDWDFSDELPSLASFKTFLRLMVALGHVRRPSLGATASGDLIAAWVNGKNRLTIECLPGDQVRWVVVKYVGDQRISAAGRNPTRLLKHFLQPYDPSSWFES